ncbi:MAG: hypothetical protein ACOC7T_04170 [Planctomycetota bacterium]
MTEEGLSIRGFMVHLTHYDPRWVERKDSEEPFSLELALELVDAMAEARMNLLVIDCADGVKYETHPELKRRYTVPMSQLEELAGRARQAGIEVVPKLNWAQSALHRHNHWFRPHHRLFDNEEYWRRSFQLVDELVEACRPERFFHIGMDEDHDRSHAQYAQAIITLHAGLAERGLRPVMWKDWQTWPSGQVHKEKSMAAEDQISRDIVQVPWNYKSTAPDVVERMVGKGFEVWGAPGGEPEKVQAWRDDILRLGGTGLLLTAWVPCRAENRDRLLELIRTCGPVCAG